MRITSKGQVTIAQAIREQAGLHPSCEVLFRLEGDQVVLEKVEEEGHPWPYDEEKPDGYCQHVKGDQCGDQWRDGLCL